MESFLWLALTIFPLLLAVAALFFWLGSRRGTGSSRLLADKDASIEREQQRTDETVRKLTATEDQLTEVQAELASVKAEFEKLLAAHEQLQRGAIPRRLLSEAEDRILKQQREIDRLSALSGIAAETPQVIPAFVAKPAPIESPSLFPDETPEVAATESSTEPASAEAKPQTKPKAKSTRRKR